MTNEHLSAARLLAIYQGQLEDFRELEHLVSCAECRRAFDDTRWLRLLSLVRERVAAGPHPSQDEIAAFHTQALPSSRIAEIERHLRSCETCLARAGQAQLSEQRARYRSPSAASVRATIQRFRPRPLRRLGTVIVSALDRGMRLVFMPERRTDDLAPPAASAPNSIRRFREVHSPHPAAAFNRARLRAKHARNYRDADDAADLFADQSGAGASGKTLSIPADDLELSLTPFLEGDNRRLDVRLASGADQPAQGVRVRLRGPAGRQVEGVTDEQGCTSLPLEPDAEELIVEREPALILGFFFSGSG